MAGKLLPYLQAISSDAAASKQFQTDPAAAAKAAGLSESETKALISKNPGALSAAIRTGGGVDEDDVNVTVVVLVA